MGLRRRELAAQIERLEEEVRVLGNQVAGLERASATTREELQRLRELAFERNAAAITELQSHHQRRLAQISEDVAAQSSALDALEELLASA
jgi:chromosome segregation ATPase